MTPTEKYEEFMRARAAEMKNDEDEPKFKEVIVSDGDGIDEFLQDATLRDVYPALALSKPPYKNFDNGGYGYFSYFNTTMYVFCKTKLEDYGTQTEKELIEQDLLNAERLVHELGSLLHQYNRRDTTPVPIDWSWNDWTAEPVKLIGSDSARGYEVKFRIGIETSDVLNPPIL